MLSASRRSNRGRSRGYGPGQAFDPRLEVAARNVDCARDDAFLPFLALAYVDEERFALALPRLGCADLVDLALDACSSSL